MWPAFPKSTFDFHTFPCFGSRIPKHQMMPDDPWDMTAEGCGRMIPTHWNRHGMSWFHVGVFIHSRMVSCGFVIRAYLSALIFRMALGPAWFLASCEAVICNSAISTCEKASLCLAMGRSMLAPWGIVVAAVSGVFFIIWRPHNLGLFGD